MHPQAGTLLQVWEQGGSQSATARALLLLSVALPKLSTERLAALSVGERDAHLLTLREWLFGVELDCLTACAACGERITVTFATTSIRAGHAAYGASYRVEEAGYDVRFRVADSSDLLAIECESSLDPAERRLLERCVLAAHDPQGVITAAELPSHVASAVAREMAEMDSQAQVVLDVACPGCKQHACATFDIVTHLWAELESWARALLEDIHTIAATYGWSEREILALGPERRRVYLQLIGA